MVTDFAFFSTVDEPCSMGCTNLQYCTNFNMNPLQLYRSCNRAADRAAENDVKIWKRGIISLPMLQDIPVKGTVASQLSSIFL